jgi:hypothetical protein
LAPERRPRTRARRRRPESDENVRYELSPTAERRRINESASHIHHLRIDCQSAMNSRALLRAPFEFFVNPAAFRRQPPNLPCSRAFVNVRRIFRQGFLHSESVRGPARKKPRAHRPKCRRVPILVRLSGKGNPAISTRRRPTRFARNHGRSSLPSFGPLGPPKPASSSEALANSRRTPLDAGKWAV